MHPARADGRPSLVLVCRRWSTDAAMYRGSSYDVVPTPVPLSHADVRFWRANDTGEPQYSVPVRLSDSGAVYDNQDTLDRLRLRHRGRAAAGDRQVPVNSDVDNGRIMRFVELRQVRAVDEHPDLGEVGRQPRSYASEDRYLVAPTVDIRPTVSCRPRCRRLDNRDVVYVNVEDARAASQQTLPDPIVEEDTEHFPGSTNTEATAWQEEQANESRTESVEQSREEEHTDEDSGVICPATESADFRENMVGQSKDNYYHEGGTASRLKDEAGDDDLTSCRQRSRPRLRAPPDAARAPIRLADAYLLRMSPPPPSQQADGRRRAAYSDPVRWVTPVSASGQRPQTETSSSTTRPSTSGRPNGLRSPAPGAGVGRTACTNEALDEAIRRRNRKCKPSAMRRLHAAKAVGSGGPETADSFEPIFEGVTCSLRARSASVSDFNALAKSCGHMVNF